MLERGEQVLLRRDRRLVRGARDDGAVLGDDAGADLRAAEVDADRPSDGHDAGTLLRSMAPDEKPYRVYKGGRAKGKVPVQRSAARARAGSAGGGRYRGPGGRARRT